jgi:hypothetical protein
MFANNCALGLSDGHFGLGKSCPGTHGEPEDCSAIQKQCCAMNFKHNYLHVVANRTPGCAGAPSKKHYNRGKYIGGNATGNHFIPLDAPLTPAAVAIVHAAGPRSSRTSKTDDTPLAAAGQVKADPIDRQALVQRHNSRIVCTTLKECSLLDYQTLGNGEFAFSVDVTGLQTFNHSIPVLHPGPGDQTTLDCPINTMSNWGWHTTPVNKSNTRTANVSNWKSQEISTYNHSALYPTGCAGIYEGDASSCPADQTQAATMAYLRANPHRLNLGRLFLASPTAIITNITDISQSLDLWTGMLSSNFSLRGRAGQQPTPVQVTTVVGTQDVVAVQLRSSLLTHGSLHFQLAFPYASEAFSGTGADWTRPNDHSSTLHCSPAPGGGGVACRVRRVLDELSYSVLISVEGDASVVPGDRPHLFNILPPTASDTVNISVAFSAAEPVAQSFGETVLQSANDYEEFWRSGAAIEFSGSVDPRAVLLEKQVVMSQYLLKSQESGSLPTQETGLTTNSWYGKFHGEMRMWHQSVSTFCFCTPFVQISVPSMAPRACFYVQT